MNRTNGGLTSQQMKRVAQIAKELQALEKEFCELVGSPVRRTLVLKRRPHPGGVTKL